MCITPKAILLLVIISLLAACQTTTPNTYGGVENKKTAAAKINVQLGMAYLERHDVQRAKQKFLLALDEGPNIPETWYSMGYYLETTGNTEQARKHYLQAVALAPTRGDVLNNYGTFLCRMGNYKGAVDNFVKATQDPKYLDLAGAYENAGLCSLKSKDTQQAMLYFKKALTEDPDRSSSLIQLAELNAKQGKYVLARKQLNQFLKLSNPTMQSYLLEKKIDEKIEV